MEELILYFDESGFTGERLLDDGQKTFAYSSVAINPLEAESITSEIIRKYKIQNVRDGFDFENLNENEIEHIDVVLELYGKYSGTELEDMTHEEEPWIRARTGFRSSQRCEVELNNSDMYTYYSSRLVD